MRPLFLILLSAPAFAQAVLVDRVVASVQTRAITRSMIDARLKQGVKDRTEARDLLIEETLISLDSARLGLTVEPEEIDRALGEIAKSNAITQEQLLAALEQQGYDLPSYREAIKRQLLSMRWAMRRVSAANQQMPPDPTERAAFLDASRKKFLEELRKSLAVELREAP